MKNNKIILSAISCGAGVLIGMLIFFLQRPSSEQQPIVQEKQSISLDQYARQNLDKIDSEAIKRKYDERIPPEISVELKAMAATRCKQFDEEAQTVLKKNEPPSFETFNLFFALWNNKSGIFFGNKEYLFNVIDFKQDCFSDNIFAYNDKLLTTYLNSSKVSDAERGAFVDLLIFKTIQELFYLENKKSILRVYDYFLSFKNLHHPLMQEMVEQIENFKYQVEQIKEIRNVTLRYKKIESTNRMEMIYSDYQTRAGK